MSIQYDKLNEAYAEKDALEYAKELGIISQDELNIRLLQLKNKIRVILGFEPVE